MRLLDNATPQAANVKVRLKGQGVSPSVKMNMYSSRAVYCMTLWIQLAWTLSYLNWKKNEWKTPLLPPFIISLLSFSWCSFNYRCTKTFPSSPPRLSFSSSNQLSQLQITFINFSSFLWHAFLSLSSSLALITFFFLYWYTFLVNIYTPLSILVVFSSFIIYPLHSFAIPTASILPPFSVSATPTLLYQRIVVFSFIIYHLHAFAIPTASFLSHPPFFSLSLSGYSQGFLPALFLLFYILQPFLKTS